MLAKVEYSWGPGKLGVPSIGREAKSSRCRAPGPKGQRTRSLDLSIPLAVPNEHRKPYMQLSVVESRRGVFHARTLLVPEIPYIFFSRVRPKRNHFRSNRRRDYFCYCVVRKGSWYGPDGANLSRMDWPQSFVPLPGNPQPSAIGWLVFNSRA